MSNILNIPSYFFIFIIDKYTGGIDLKGIVEQRAIELAEYIVENKATVRDAAKKFGISKSTVHIDVSQRLKKLNPLLYSDVRKILDINKAERHIRGGMATKQKFLK